MQAVSNVSVLQPMRSAARRRMLRAAFAVVSMSIPISFWAPEAVMRCKMPASALTRQSTVSRSLSSSEFLRCSSSASIIFLCFGVALVNEDAEVRSDLVVVRRPSSCFCVIVLR